MMTNEGEFEQVYAMFQPKIHRYLTRLVGDKEAEDLTQEVFIKIDGALKTFRHESQLSTWIYRIATNAAIDRMRNPAFKRELAKDIPEGGFTDAREQDLAISAKTCATEEEVAHKETSECIRGVIENLPEHYRTILILSELEGLRNKEIAEVLGLSLDTVKVRLHRGKARLKQELTNYCDFYWDERNELTCDPKAPVKK